MYETGNNRKHETKTRVKTIRDLRLGCEVVGERDPEEAVVYITKSDMP